MKNILPDLFQSLEDKNINYAVLRGFENLPTSYSNDIDFGVLIENLNSFISVLGMVSKQYNCSIKVYDLRLDVLKLSLVGSGDPIDIDIWSSFNYAGLTYLNHKKIISEYTYHNGIKVLKPENELALSFLKEVLHMKRLRKDKVAILQSRINDSYKIAFSEYFSDHLIEKSIESIQTEKFDLTELSSQMKKKLIFKNFSKNGFFRTISFFIQFIIIRINRKYLISKKQNSINSSLLNLTL